MLEGFAQAQQERWDENTLAGKLDWLTMGILSGAWKGSREQAEKVLTEPSVYNIGNWLTMGLFDLGQGALTPDEPLSLEHWLSSFGFAAALYEALLVLQQGIKSYGERTQRAGDIPPHRLKSINTDGYTVIETRDPEIANAEWLARGYDKPPYDPNYEVKIVKGGSNSYVRVYTYRTDGTSGKLGGWLMKKADIEGLTSAQIADKYALPEAPTHVCDVLVPGDFELQTGIANKVPDWGNGGGQQFDTIAKKLSESNFINERTLS